MQCVVNEPRQASICIAKRRQASERGQHNKHKGQAEKGDSKQEKPGLRGRWTHRPILESLGHREVAPHLTAHTIGRGVESLGNLSRLRS
jgi:hypothetical protein